MKTLSELRNDGYKDLEGRWGNAVVLTIVYLLVASGVSYLFGKISENISLLSSILLFPMAWGYTTAFLDNTRGIAGKPLDIANLWNGYKDFMRIAVTYLLTQIYIVLWTLLLIVPGIIKGYSYAMVPYILRDDPTISGNRAIELSMQMMEGNKMRLFTLHLTFIGWIVLACLTLGIGFLFVMPYIESTIANFYEELKGNTPVSTNP